MSYVAPITVLVLLVLLARKLLTKNRQDPDLEHLRPGESLESLTSDLETAMATAVRELDICQPHIMRDNWPALSKPERDKRVIARRRYIIALEEWRKAEECLLYDGTNGNIDLRMIGSIPLVRRAGIHKARSSVKLARELQQDMRSEGWMN